MASNAPLLFDALPGLRGRTPWVDLGLERSPVHRLASLGSQLGHDALYIKRDDRVSTIYGGNKGRKLEFLLGEALERGKQTVIGLGTTGSNQCVANAAFARDLGLHVVAALVPQPVLETVRRNLLLDLHLGSEFIYEPDYERLGARVIERLRADPSAYLIAPGGNTPLGNLGFVNAALELSLQIEAGELPKPDRIFIAGGSTGSAAGLRLGLELAGLAVRVHVVQASAAEWCTAEILARTERELRDAIGATAGRWGPPSIFDTSAFGRGYAIATEEGRAALRLLSEREGIELEPCYTAKSFAAFCRFAERQTSKPTRETLLFWHTANSLDLSAAIESEDYRRLPRELHAIFESPLPEPTE